MAKISINELFDELSDENNRLLNELLFAQKCIQLFESFVFRLKVVNNKCKCDQRINNKVLFKDMENSYKCLFEKFSKTLELNNFVNNKDLINNTIHKTNRFQTNGIDFECEKFDTNYEKKNKSEGIVNNEESVNSSQSTTDKKRINNKDLNKKAIDLEILKESKNIQTKHKYFESNNETNSESEETSNVNKRSEYRSISPECEETMDWNQSSESSLSNDNFIDIYNNKKLHQLSQKEISIVLKENEYIEEVDDNEPLISSLKLKLKDKPEIEYSLKFAYRCNWSECEYINSRRYRIKGHIDKEHINKKKVKCSECNLEFVSQVELSRHRLESHKYRCDYPDCKYEAQTQSSLKRHQICHSTDRNYVCEWPGCDWAFKTSYQLTKHRLIHTNQRKYKCDWPECGEHFLRVDHLKLHQMRHTGTEPYVCEWPECGRRFPVRARLEFHKQSVHSMGKKWFCDFPDCNRVFNTTVYLVKHSNLHLKLVVGTSIRVTRTRSSISILEPDRKKSGSPRVPEILAQNYNLLLLYKTMQKSDYKTVKVCIFSKSI